VPVLGDLLRRCEQHSAHADALVQAVAVLLGRARSLLDEALAQPDFDRAEAVENVACEVELLVSQANSLALHADDLHGELRDLVKTSTRLARDGRGTCAHGDYERVDLVFDGSEQRLDGGEEALRRLLGCGVLVLDELHAAVQAAGPTPRERAALNDLLGRLKPPID
jgi:hypothetical protein